MTEFNIKPAGVEGASSSSTPSEVQKPNSTGANRESFTDTLKEALEEVNDLQNRSTEEIERVLDGDLKDVHSAMLALQKADLSFQLMLQVRNKLVQAYRDIMRMG